MGIPLAEVEEADAEIRFLISIINPASIFGRLTWHPIPLAGRRRMAETNVNNMDAPQSFEFNKLNCNLFSKLNQH